MQPENLKTCWAVCRDTIDVHALPVEALAKRRRNRPRTVTTLDALSQSRPEPSRTFSSTAKSLVGLMGFWASMSERTGIEAQDQVGATESSLRSGAPEVRTNQERSCAKLYRQRPARCSCPPTSSLSSVYEPRYKTAKPIIALKRSDVKDMLRFT